MTEIETTELEPHKKLTYSELVNILCILAVRLGKLEDLVETLCEAMAEGDEFPIKQILTARMELMRHIDKDIPYKRFTSTRITELEKSFKGFLTYYHENLDKKNDKKVSF